jgi:hypothetical protein
MIQLRDSAFQGFWRKYGLVKILKFLSALEIFYNIIWLYVMLFFRLPEASR